MCVKDRPAGADPRGGVDRGRHGEVRGVRPVPQRAQDQDVEPLEQPVARFGHAAAVRQVREAPGTVPEDRPRSVQDRHRHERVPRHVERASDLDGPHLRDASAVLGLLRERVLEHPPEVGQGMRVAIERHGPTAHHVEPPDLVEPEDVVGVAVGVDDRVDAGHPVPERLCPQVRRRIHEHLHPVVERQQDRRTGPRVARIVGSAHRALAADHRHPVRRAAAEERDSHDQGMMMRVSCRAAST